MKKFVSLLLIVAMAHLAVCWGTSAFASEPDKAVVRAVYRAEFTPAIAKSVGVLSRISEGDRFAVAQLPNATWALALLASGTLDQLALPLAGRADLASAGQVKLLHLLTPGRGLGLVATQTAGAQP